jgi:hypothetical protein
LAHSEKKVVSSVFVMGIIAYFGDRAVEPGPFVTHGAEGRDGMHATSYCDRQA